MIVIEMTTILVIEDTSVNTEDWDIVERLEEIPNLSVYSLGFRELQTVLKEGIH